MIGYRITRAALENLIETSVPGWLARAAVRTAGFAALGRYEESSSIWSEVKPVYMQLQGGSKCAYCERKLESVELGKGEQDVEHFRPKKSVKKWKPSAALTQAGVAPVDPPASGGGYYLLAYHPFNYCASCKPCNSVLKGDRFPVAGPYKLNGADPAAMTSEKPLLVYPIGDFDGKPEDLIGFTGVSPHPLASSGHKRKRALATIEFFALDDPVKRKNLVLERAHRICFLALLLAKRDAAAPAGRPGAEARINTLLQPDMPHANCSASYVRLHDQDPVLAASLAESAWQFIAGSS
jgi:hypothetical protein